MKEIAPLGALARRDDLSRRTAPLQYRPGPVTGREPTYKVGASMGERYVMKQNSIILVTLILSAALASAQEPSTNWPCWRGPNGDGVADGRKLPLRWSHTENVRWSVKLPGWGTSSPVVFGNQVFVTSQLEKDGKKSLLTLCFDRKDGKELRQHDFGFGVNQKTNPKSNLAVNTPAVTEDAVYVAFGNADIARYAHDGKLIWVQRYIPTFGDPKMAWG